MATYVVGDIQGCLSSLRHLLDQCKFDPAEDVLWVAGDLINRGPQSLQTLRFIRSLGKSAIVVLGNHDLHCLAVAHGHTHSRKKDTLDEIIAAKDRDDLLEWLRYRKLMHVSDDNKYLMVHAGIPPIWNSHQAMQYAAEIETVLQSDDLSLFLDTLYGNLPDTWNEVLQGPERWRLITNYFTRMRFCDANGKLELDCKLGPEQAPPTFQPWYRFPHQLMEDQTLLFGHWASLNGKTGLSQFVALDTGCVWGGKLSIVRLEDKKRFQCDC